MSWKHFGQTFISALLGGIIYEVIIYLTDKQTPDLWSSIVEVLIIAFVVTAVIMLLRSFTGNRSSE